MPDLTVEDDNGVTRVTLGLIASNPDDYGLKVVAADGSTAIIDGTSDVFKIVASGTQSNTFLDNATANVQATLSAAGPMAVAPAHLFYFSASSAPTVLKSPNPSFRQGAFSDEWSAAGSGGATTTRYLGTFAWIEGGTFLDGSSNCVVQMTGILKGAGTSLTLFSRYYVLVEAAM